MLMKTLLALLLSLSFAVGAQNVDYNAIILPENATQIDFSEKLVRLAWQNNPSVAILHNELDRSSQNIKFSRWNWLDNFRITGNLNEFNINQSNNPFEGSQFYPRYNISASISLGTLFTNPIKTKIEKINSMISVDQINLKKLQIRSEVLRKYEVYQGNKDIYDIRTQMLEDSYSDYKLKEQSFSRGEITMIEYTNSLDRYNQQRINKIQSEKELQISKIELEELIGVKLSDVQQ